MHIVFPCNTFYHRSRLLTILVVLVCLVTCFTGNAEAQDVYEDQIKSVFLFNLTHFVTWPFPDDQRPSTFNIGVYGNASFQKVLAQTVESETKDGHQLKVTSVRDLTKITNECRIVFIAKEVGSDWERIHKKIKGLPILTVSDLKDFASRGGMVALLRENNNIKIEVNYTRVQQAGLSMSAKLLRLARIVE